MSRSAGFRFFVLGALILLMFIPLFFVGAIIDDRSNYSRDAIRSVGQDWGGPQVINGPQIVVPVEGPVTRLQPFTTTDPSTGEQRTESREVTEIERKSPLTLSPDHFEVAMNTVTSERRRGIFRVPVFTATSQIQFDLAVPDAGPFLEAGEVALWNQAYLVLGLTDNRALRGAAVLTIDGTEFALSPRPREPGIQAAIGDPRAFQSYELTLGFNGAESLDIVPIGRDSVVTMTSDWPHPSFAGAFLPDGSEITENGFRATWTIPHLARNLPQATRGDYANAARTTAFGVQFYQPNDFYQKAYRAARYGILFIALTFLTVFLIENRAQRPVHPVQFILIGLAQSIFVLLMVSYAEQIGFGPAYAASAGATIALLVLFGATGLQLGRRTWVLGAMLVVLYSVLYLILRSADYALLAGSTLAFGALAATVIATRNEDWYGPERTGPRRGWFTKRPPSTPSTQSSEPPNQL
ncbi:cell envelope integrity protein CreD [Flavimaricola marinus]|uniref:Inner membrane protein CreD n=1 Tax=Flavimaricola marinus TaxID=1819565 RepID=A0A238L8Y6_9RHOB|nr:cell envelope integrity protein CreD [Flavimaricola marinus]SMY06061.1 Inner membrane protein CreD [Flavimaricola marinus]